MGSHLSIVYYLSDLISLQLAVGGRHSFPCQVEMFLGSWGRLLILVAGGTVVIVAIIIVTCFVGPGCWGFEYLQREEKKKKLGALDKIQPEVGNNADCKLGHYYWLDNNDYVIYETGPWGLEEKVSKTEKPPLHLPKERVFNLKCAPLLVAPNLYTCVKDSAPKLELKISYSGLGKDDVMRRLSIHIIAVTFLPCREYIATLDPYALLQILNNKWSLHKSERIVHTVQTRVVKNNTNPTFDQCFVFDVKKIDMKNWCLKLTILDSDRLTRVTPLFEKRVYLKDYKNLTTETPISLSLEMQEVSTNTGALLFGISYLPTAKRLNFSVIKACGLKYQNLVENVADFCPYVRIVMVNNHGKCLKKKKTSFRLGDESPVFNQSLIFDLSISNLEQTVFLVLLCTKTLVPAEDSSVEEDIENSLKQSKDRVLGTIVLGRNVKCTRARDHWVTVMQNPRKMISVWHDLR